VLNFFFEIIHTHKIIINAIFLITLFFAGSSEIEKDSLSGKVFSKCLVIEVLPAPEGAVMMSDLVVMNDHVRAEKEELLIGGTF
jgi:hypothetical protein